jgi:uncharacterized protein (TIGR02301 family)
MARRIDTRIALVVLLACGSYGDGQAQQAVPAHRKKPPVEKPTPAPAPVPAVNPHHKPLIDLSEMIGALAFLADICSPGAGLNPWRIRMETLLETEGEASGIRDRLTGAFNQGYADYSTSYRQCTPSARAAQRLLTRDAARGARDIERRFGS